MRNTKRLTAWNNIEAKAQALVAEMDRVAASPDWKDGDIERWQDVYDALSRRPRLTLNERDLMSGRFQK